MTLQKKIIFIIIITILANCHLGSKKKYKKEINLSEQEINKTNEIIGKDTIELIRRPTKVISTGLSQHKLIPVFKEMYNKKHKEKFISGINYHYNYMEEHKVNNWNNYMPGIEALYGYNMQNIGFYNSNTKKRKNLFDKSVLINTLYFPTTSKDTLQGKPIFRDYYLVSVYDEDTNKDSVINTKDLRKLYHFDKECEIKTKLIPNEYSVISSDYDKNDDYMYIFSRLDENKNGEIEKTEPVHVFWIDLKNPETAERAY